MMHTAGRLFESVPTHPHLRPMQLPWPMTRREATRWVVVCLVACLLPAAVIAWVTASVTEPSIWRLGFALMWLLAFKALVLPLLVQHQNPGDVDARWHRWGTQEHADGQS